MMKEKIISQKLNLVFQIAPLVKKNKINLKNQRNNLNPSLNKIDLNCKCILKNPFLNIVVAIFIIIYVKRKEINSILFILKIDVRKASRIKIGKMTVLSTQN